MEWGIAAALLLALPASLYFLQDRMIFHPQPMAPARHALTAQHAQSIFIHAGDGTRLHAWHRAGSPLVLYFGGNAEEVSWMLGAARREAPGTGWLLVDYRGYGSSAGTPSEKALVRDAIELFDHAREKLGAKKVVLFGRSLGSGVAVQVAAARSAAGLILVAPYDSMTSIGQHHYPFLPVRWMLKHRFDSLGAAAAVRAPALFLVAERDEVIPPVHSKRLFEAWQGPKRWVEVNGAGHNSTDDAPVFWPAIREFLVQLN
jgi:hypothetical protein